MWRLSSHRVMRWGEVGARGMLTQGGSLPFAAQWRAHSCLTGVTPFIGTVYGFILLATFHPLCCGWEIVTLAQQRKQLRRGATTATARTGRAAASIARIVKSSLRLLGCSCLDHHERIAFLARCPPICSSCRHRSLQRCSVGKSTSPPLPWRPFSTQPVIFRLSLLPLPLFWPMPHLLSTRSHCISMARWGRDSTTKKCANALASRICCRRP